MSIYSDLAKTALGLLSQFGQTVTRREYVSAAYDPATGTAARTFVDTSRKGAIFDFGPGTTTIRGQLIQVTDQQLLLDATGPVTLNDHFVVNGKEYTVVTLGGISPAGTPVIYDLHLRNG